MVFMSRRCSLPLASPYILCKRPCSSSSSRDRELNPSIEAPSSRRSNSSSPEDIAHSRERGEDAPPSPERSSSGSTPKARASLRNVPKRGREILPLSIPETVVGLTPASSARRTWVHIRLSRMITSFLPTKLLSMLNLSISNTCTLPHIWVETVLKTEKLSANCLQTVVSGVQWRCRKRHGSGWEPRGEGGI